jgi:hypothetical protein
MKRAFLRPLLSAFFALASSCERREFAPSGDSTGPLPVADTQVAQHMPEHAPRIVRDDGAYELVAMLEGAEANQRFSEDLKKIGRQREELGRLEAQWKTAPAGSSDRVAIDSSLTSVRKSLAANLDTMMKTYGYSVDANHTLVPLESELHQISVNGVSERVREIRTPADYDRLQALRAQYEMAAKSGDPASADAAAIAGQLKREFSFDVTGHYNIRIIKGALYRKVK